MNADPNTAKAIFLEAVEKHDPGEWPAFLDQACAGQPDLRRRVEVLLEAHREAGTAANRARSDQPSTGDEGPADELPGTVIGPYKLLQQIGEGGMGTVFMAEQTQPVQRKVALKIIKPGMDSRQVIARFEAERRVLALMDHPHIAKVFDAGTTQRGRPYFVMELVKGVPITQYCDEHRLTPRQRLELFLPVCQAVQHAHQKGIIHRDLKPSNVLVAEYDDQPVAKVIDFGVAKPSSVNMVRSATSARSDVASQLDQIIRGRSGLEDWREAVVKHPEVITYCEQREIRKRPHSDEIYLLKKKQMNGTHAELFSYALYKELNNAAVLTDLLPLKLLPYQSVTTIDVEPHIILRYYLPNRSADFLVESTMGEFRLSVERDALRDYPELESMLCDVMEFSERRNALDLRCQREGIQDVLYALASTLSEHDHGVKPHLPQPETENCDEADPLSPA
jgi:tRNA A-37 threonylcarbamoyl transferase component Bud32